MELKELRQKIKDSPSWELFVNEETHLDFPRIGLRRKFTGVSAFYEYVLDQIEGFRNIEGDKPQEIDTSFAYFKDLRSKIISFFSTYQNIQPNDFSRDWNRDVKQYTNGNRTLSIFEYNAPVTKFLIDVFQNKPKNYKGALHYISQSIVVSELQARDYLNGVILAYEYYQQGQTEIEKRRKKEKSSLTQLRNQVDKYISEAENQFILLSKSQEASVKATTDEIESYRLERSKFFEEWLENTTNEFSKFDEAAKKKVTELETLYRDKLKLEAPAQYWRERSASLRKEGYWWLGSLVVSILVGVGLLVFSLQLLSDGVLEDIFSDTPSAIKWSVIFLTFVSFLAFLIKTFSKLTFSAFHLVRDAEEREHLTIVFLSMQKEQAIDPTERHLIMQSLFSRADTGLLKDEGSPTMPGNFFDKIVTKG